MNKKETERLFFSLKSSQISRLQDFLGLILASLEGRATEEEVMECIVNLPAEDVKPFSAVLNAISK